MSPTSHPVDGHRATPVIPLGRYGLVLISKRPELDGTGL